MQLLDGKSLSQTLTGCLKSQIDKLPVPPSLDVVLVGDDTASQKYVAMKRKKAQELGVNFTLHQLSPTITQDELLKMADNLNSDSAVNGYFFQLPLPSHINRHLLLSAITPVKDVDGLNPASGVTPAVVAGIITLLTHYQIPFTGQKIVVINDSPLIGQPLKSLLTGQGAFVTLANDQTQDLSSLTSQADILISATGVAGLVTSGMVKPGSVVVDVASGDVDFSGVAPLCRFITPTFGGVGPMTVVSLYQNLLKLTHENPAI